MNSQFGGLVVENVEKSKADIDDLKQNCHK